MQISSLPDLKLKVEEDQDLLDFPRLKDQQSGRVKICLDFPWCFKPKSVDKSRGEIQTLPDF